MARRFLNQLALAAAILIPAPALLRAQLSAQSAPSSAAGAEAAKPASIPTDWVDADTGHRVVRLSREDGSMSSYFHQNQYTPDGKYLIYFSPSGLYRMDFATRASEKILEGQRSFICVGRKTGLVYYLKRDDQGANAIWSVDPVSKAAKQVVVIPQEVGIANINSDETLAGGTVSLTAPRGQGARRGDGATSGTRGQGGRRGARGARGAATANAATSGTGVRAQRPGFGTPNTDRDMMLATVNLQTGEVKKFAEQHAWENHIQFSPTDPSRMMFCNEGTWQLMDRIWTVRTDGSGLLKVHQRTMNNEIFGHEFFSPDGKTIYYDLQTPRSTVFWLGSYNLETKERIWYNLQRDQWSVHYNISPDMTVFSGDGGGPASVAAPGNGQWMYLFRPKLDPLVTGGATDPANTVHAGHFDAERLVNLKNHDYTLEPNGQFTPDGKWLIFRSNMFGPSHVYMVELAKAK